MAESVAAFVCFVSLPDVSVLPGAVVAEVAAAVVESLGVTITFTDKAVEKIADEGIDDTYGARPLRRAIVTNIEDKLSERMLEPDFDSTKPITCDYDGEQFTFNSTEE